MGMVPRRASRPLAIPSDAIVLQGDLFVYCGHRRDISNFPQLRCVLPSGRFVMRLWLVGLTAALLSTSAYAQSTSAPEIPFESVPNFVKLPPDMHLGEATGVAVNSKGNVLVYSRGGSSQGPAFGNTASQLLEFDRDGNFIREIGKGLSAWSFAHTVRFDKDD